MVLKMDSTFTKAIRLLHSNNLESTYYLGVILDEAMRTCYGSNPELSSLLNHPPPEYHSANTNVMYNSVVMEIKDESRTCSSSDNELELDLLKEDLMCVVCKGMDVAAKNQLLECHECHSLYHQECHDPPIYQEELDSQQVWYCGSCKRMTEVIKATGRVEKREKMTSASPTNIYEREMSERNSLKMSSKSSKHTSSSYSSRAMTPNINIISADKRIQIMKKKAANKMQEKRKLNNR